MLSDVQEPSWRYSCAFGAETARSCAQNGSTPDGRRAAEIAREQGNCKLHACNRHEALVAMSEHMFPIDDRPPPLGRARGTRQPAGIARGPPAGRSPMRRTRPWPGRPAGGPRASSAPTRPRLQSPSPKKQSPPGAHPTRPRLPRLSPPRTATAPGASPRVSTSASTAPSTSTTSSPTSTAR